MASSLRRHDKRARFRHCPVYCLSCGARNAFDSLDRTHLWHRDLLRERAGRHLCCLGSQDIILQHDPLRWAWSVRFHDDTVDCARVLSDTREIGSWSPPEARPGFGKLDASWDSMKFVAGPRGFEPRTSSRRTFGNLLQMT